MPLEIAQLYCCCPSTTTDMRWVDLLMLIRISARASPAVTKEPLRQAQTSKKITARQRIRTPGSRYSPHLLVNVPVPMGACQRFRFGRVKGQLRQAKAPPQPRIFAAAPVG